MYRYLLYLDTNIHPFTQFATSFLQIGILKKTKTARLNPGRFLFIFFELFQDSQFVSHVPQAVDEGFHHALSPHG